MAKKNHEVKISTILYALIILLVLYLTFVAVSLYGFGVENNFVKSTLRFLPFPAAFVGEAKYISIGELKNDLTAIKSFYENQDFSQLGYRIDFSTAEGQKRLKIKERKLLEKLIENSLIAKASKENDLILDAEVLAKETDSRMEQYGSQEETSRNLKKVYGWSLKEFTEKVVKPEMQKEILEKYLKKNEPNNVAAQEKIDRALGEIKKSTSFAIVAKKYSEGESAEKGGELGWFSSDQMIPEIALAVKLLAAGETSNVLESSLGYHIINVEEKKTENGVEMTRIKQIFVRTKNFSDWLLAQEKKTKIYIPLYDFYWDKESQSVKFKDKTLEEFEKNLEENSAGDVSVIF
jgi:parvulin-like peptidyl-prolyl isomerase